MYTAFDDIVYVSVVYFSYKIQSSIIKQGDSDFSEIYIYNHARPVVIPMQYARYSNIFKLYKLLAAKIISFLGRDNLVIKIQLLRS